jgi:hypothetical protein
MIKKEYMEPQIEVLDNKEQLMIQISTEESTGQGGWGGPLSLDSDFEEVEN